MIREEKAREHAANMHKKLYNIVRDKDPENYHPEKFDSAKCFIEGAKWQARKDRDNIIRALDYLFELMHGTIVGSTDAHVKWLKNNFIRKYEE